MSYYEDVSHGETFYPKRKMGPEELLRLQRQEVKSPYVDQDTLHRYSKSPDPATRYSVAKNPKTLVKTLLGMVRDGEKDKRVPVLLTQNPTSTAEILQMLIINNEDNVYVFRNAAWHNNITSGLLHILAHKEDVITQFGVLKNRKTNKETLIYLADNAKDEGIRRMALERLKQTRK